MIQNYLHDLTFNQGNIFNNNLIFKNRDKTYNFFIPENH